MKTLPTNVLYETTECDLFHLKPVKNYYISREYQGNPDFNDFSMPVNDEMNMYCILRSHVPSNSHVVIDFNETDGSYVVPQMRKIAEKRNFDITYFSPEKEDEAYFYKKLKEHQKKGFDLIQPELDSFQKYLSTIAETGNNGLIFIIANPFTYGHQYLIEYAASQCDNLYIASTKKDMIFTGHDRWEMLKIGTSHIKNLHFIKPHDFIGTEILLWPFLFKDLANPNYIDFEYQNIVTLDIYCKTLNIKTRFFGEEPTDAVARVYMNEFIEKGKKYNVKADVIKRKEIEHNTISATYIRQLYKENPQEIKKYVPDNVFDYLMKVRPNYEGV